VNVETKYTADDLASEIVQRRAFDLDSRVKVSPRSTSILSDISDCDRQMTYAVLDWNKKPAHDGDLQARFDAGNAIEAQVVAELQRLGFKVTLSQMPVEIKNRKGEVIARGRVDGFIEIAHHHAIPFEVKSMNPNIFNGIKDLQDFKGKPWLRKYIRQLSMYLFGNNVESGLFILTDGLGRWKVLPLTLDYGEAEAILQRLERVHEAIKTKTYPDRITYDQGICGHCSFAALCLPDLLNKEAALVDNQEIEAKLERRMELKPSAKEYSDLDDEIKETFRGIDKAIVGGKWLVQNVPSQRTTYELPPELEAEIDEMKKAHAVKKATMRLVIERLGDK